jgi:hypothetical protein
MQSRILIDEACKSGNKMGTNTRSVDATSDAAGNNNAESQQVEDNSISDKGCKSNNQMGLSCSARQISDRL